MGSVRTSICVVWFVVISSVLLACGGHDEPHEEVGTSVSALAPGNSTCLSHAMKVTAQPGPTQGLWAHTEPLASAPAVSTRAEFVFVFDRIVSSDEVARAVSISLVSCPDQASPPPHNVALTVAPVASGVYNAVVVRHASESFMPGCTYALHVPGDKPLDELHTCLSAGNDFSFRVLGPHEASAFQNEAVAIRYRPKTFDVAAFKEPVGRSLALPSAMNRYAEDLGVRPFVDTFKAGAPARPSTIDANGFVRTYAQLYLGVPVLGYGYTAVEDSTGNVRSVTGRNAKSIGLRATPNVLELVASTAALTHLLLTHPAIPPPLYRDHDSALVVVSTTSAPRAPEFHLAWRIHFVEAHSGQGFIVLVDALNGAILQTHSTLLSQCAPTDTSRLTVVSNAVQASVPTFQSDHYNDPAEFFLAQYSGGSGTSYVLQTNKFGATSRAVCGGGISPIATTLAAVPGLVADATWSPETTSTAASYMGVQRCLDYFAAQPFRAAIGQTPTPDAGWLGFDGAGAVPIGVHVGNFPDEFHPDLKELFFRGSTAAQVGTGAALDTVCHEFGHGVLNELLGATTTLESSAVAEAFADISGAVVEHSVRSEGDWNGCQGGDLNLNPLTVANGCIRNFVHPELSSGGLTTTVGGSAAAPSPDAYLSGNYADPITAGEDVFVHRNSTVMSRWFYLLAHGGDGLNSLKCPYDLQPFDAANPAAGWDEAYSLLFRTMHERAQADDQFVDIANETISAADSIYAGAPDHDDRVSRVVNAWAAVNVWESFWEGKNDTIVPAMNQKNVNPWAPIKWLAQDGESSWDVQIFSPDARTLYADIGGPNNSPPAVQETTTVNGKRYAVLRLALSPNTHYFWRTRPHSADAWSDCYPVHFFDTGDVPKVDGLLIVNTLTTDNRVRPGNIEVGWNRLAGASEYKIFVGPLATQQPCAITDGTQVVTVPADPNSAATGLTALVRGVQYRANTPFVFQVQALGPSDVTGTHPTSNCAVLDFNLAPPRPPTLNFPPDGFAYQYLSPHLPIGDDFPISFTAYDGSVDVMVTFYQRDAQGNCLDTFPHGESVRVSCPGNLLNECPGTITGDIFPAPNPNGPWANPTGYCWDVAEMSDNGFIGSLEHKRKFGYGMPGPRNQAPGVQIGAVEAGQSTNPPGFSLDYGAPVTFSWDKVPSAQSYFIEVGKWPWSLGGAPKIPSSCLPIDCIGAPVAGPTLPATQFTGTSTTIKEGENNASVSKGRYCWTIWPVLSDPDHPDQPNARQPSVLPQANTYCYSSEPAKPQIFVDNPPSGSGFSSARITGHVLFPYVPDTGNVPFVQLDASTPQLPGSTKTGDANCSPTTTSDPLAWAPGQNFMFNDLYDCTIQFSFEPTKNTSYVIHAHANGYTSVVEADPKPFSTGSCGGTGEACCAGNSCDAGNNCTNGRCGGCGGHNQECCATGTMCTSGFTCHNNKCLDCAIPSAPTITSPVHGPNDFCQIPTVSVDANGVTPCSFTGTDHAVKWVIDYTTFAADPGSAGCFVPGSTILQPRTEGQVNGLLSCAFRDIGPGTGDRIVEWTVQAINECDQRSAPSALGMFHAL
jgi:Zn-dependent metalloprotease